MAITPFSDDMTIIGKLSDEPTLDGSLTAQQFKDRFDAGGKAIQTYINNTLVPAVMAKPDGVGLLKSDTSGVSVAVAGADYQAPLGEKSISRSMLGDDVTAAALGGIVPVAKTVILPASGWADNKNTVTVEGLTKTSNVIVTPAPESYLVWAESLIRAVTQADGSLTFQCEDVPADVVTANILIVG